MKKSLILVLLLTIVTLFLIPVNLIAGEGDSTSHKRNFWFYGQRFVPLDTIYEELMQNALDERDDIRSGGYFLNPVSYSWQCIGGLTGRINTVKFADNSTLIIGAPNTVSSMLILETVFIKQLTG